PARAADWPCAAHSAWDGSDAFEHHVTRDRAQAAHYWQWQKSRYDRSADGLRPGPRALFSPPSDAGRMDSNGREPRRAANRTSDEIRACPQSSDRKVDGSHDPATPRRPRRRGDRMTAFGPERTPSTGTKR